MTGSPLKRVSPGQRWKPTAEWVNAVTDAARDYQQRQLLGEAALPRGAAAQTVILVRNQSGSAVDRYGVLSLAGQSPIITAAANLASFQEQPTMDGVTAAGGGEAFVIMLEAVPAGVIGRAVIAGAVQVQVNVTDASHAFAESESGHLDRLKSRADGQNAARILWKESGTGTGKWALVLLPIMRDSASGATITVEEVDGTPSYSGITTLRFDQADGFSLSNPSAGVARVDFTAAPVAFSGARVYDSGLGQSIPSGTPTAVTFDSEQYDTDSYHSGGNPSRLTAPATGYYHMGGWISWNGSSFVGSVGLSFYMLINGSTFFVPVQVLRVTVGSENAGQHLSTDYHLSAGDYVELFASQASGGTLALNTSPQAWIHRLPG